MYIALSYLLLYFFPLSSYVQGREKENSFVKVQKWFISYRATSHKFLTSFLLQEKKFLYNTLKVIAWLRNSFRSLSCEENFVLFIWQEKRDAAGNWPSRLLYKLCIFVLVMVLGFVIIYFRLGMILGIVIKQAKPYYIWNSFLKLRASIFNPLWQCFRKQED